MLFRVWIAIVVWTTATLGVTASAQEKYPDWKGAWARFRVPGIGGQPSFDQTKPWGRGQQAPLTPEYQAVFEASLADQAAGGQGNFIDHSARCLVETRGPFKGPRAFDATGLPLHFDNQSVFKERIYRDKVDPKILHDQITVFDHALTRPWVVDKKYVLDPNSRPRWGENNCMETNNLVAVGKEMYAISADGHLMPVKKDQAPPDLRYFKKYDR
jgi:hypothetical protein